MFQAINSGEKYTYADYLTWPDEERWEIIDGVPFSMGPAPNREHQRISMVISNRIFEFVKNGKCEVYTAPMDVRLSDNKDEKNNNIKTIVQPDIMVICDKSKLDEQGCLGAPDIVVEILSPSSAYNDETKKLNMYERYGIKEYWIINPEAEYIMVYHLKDLKFNKPEYFKIGDILESVVLKGFKMKLSDLWPLKQE